MKQIQNHTGCFAILLVIVTLCTLVHIPMTDIAIDNASVVTKNDDVHIDYMTKTNLSHIFVAHLSLNKGSYRLTKTNHNLFFRSYFAILFKVVIIPNAIFMLIFTVMVSLQSAARRIITFLHRMDGKKSKGFLCIS